MSDLDSEVIAVARRFEVLHLHVAAHLIRNLFHDLISKVTAGQCCIVFDELDDFTLTASSHVVSEYAIITIELLHGREVSITNANDDD